jgi:cullin 3
MTHIDLVNEAIRQLAGRFNPEPILIKRRIESLIEVRYFLVSLRTTLNVLQREYLERCEDRKSYNYLVGTPLF